MRLEIPLLFAALCLCSAKVEFNIDIAERLKHFTTNRYPSEAYGDNLENARVYIKKEFKRHGLNVEIQEFNTSVNTHITDLRPHDEEVIGKNIIGIAPSKSDVAGAVVVVLADYDSNGMDNPMMNNGAGMAVLLETVKTFMYNVKWSSEFSQDYTTVFAAIDLNTREHMASGGKPGSWYFVNNWLWNFLNQSDTNFGGAYVIDSVMNINQAVKSQIVNADFKQMFPDTYQHIMDNDEKGNFLSMVTLNNEKSIQLKEQFQMSYNKDRMKRPFTLQDMTLPKSLAMSKLLASLTRQATIHFWAFTHNNGSVPLPAVLVSDTESLRNVPFMDDCTDLCQLTPEREEFIEVTTFALTRTLLARQAHVIKSAGNMITTLPVLILSMVTLLLVSKN